MVEEERTAGDWLRLIFPRVLRAVVWGFIMGGEIFLLPLLFPNFGGPFGEYFSMTQFSFSYLALVFLVFEVAIQLFHGTIIQYGLSMARALISIISLVLITNGGVMTFTLTPSAGLPLPPGSALVFTVDFRTILGIFLIFSLLSILKNLLQAVDFLSKKAEEPVIPPELP